MKCVADFTRTIHERICTSHVCGPRAQCWFMTDSFFLTPTIFFYPIGPLVEHGEGLLSVLVQQESAGKWHHHHGPDLLWETGEGDQGQALHPLRQLAVNVSLSTFFLHNNHFLLLKSSLCLQIFPLLHNFMILRKNALFSFFSFRQSVCVLGDGQ